MIGNLYLKFNFSVYVTNLSNNISIDQPIEADIW